jgi:hypothetical protein
LASASAVGEFPPFSNSFAIAAVVCKFTPVTRYRFYFEQLSLPGQQGTHIYVTWTFTVIFNKTTIWPYSNIIPIPNVMVEWLTLLLRNQEILGSNFGPGDWLSWFESFVVFLSPSRQMPE